MRSDSEILSDAVVADGVAEGIAGQGRDEYAWDALEHERQIAYKRGLCRLDFLARDAQAEIAARLGYEDRLAADRAHARRCHRSDHEHTNR